MIKFFEKDPYSPIEYTYEVKSVLYRDKSKYQEILVIENPYFGRMLILDGIVQLTERDEFFYHEMLTHVVMHAHPNPKRVVVIGGGDGGVVREVLKHKTVEKVYLVEIDEQIIEVSKRFFPTLSCNIDDPKVEIRITEGAAFMRRISSPVDVIIVDSTDIIGIARSLFTEDFFNLAEKALNKEGMFVTHSESFHFHLDIVREVYKTLKKAFRLVDLYGVTVATYPGNWWAFCTGSKKLNPRDIRRPFEIETNYYDDEIHNQAFLPHRLYRKLMDRKPIW